ncbi:MAG: tetratricopeptide repeat protein [Nitrosomonadales bacterium]|nr:tetratricopeptide repeat protein [Nitrosomonadales bacterium]
MAALDLQEQEQVDTLKHWWADNGKWVVVAVAVGLAVFAGVKFWNNYQTGRAVEAATLYEELGKQLSSNDPKRINDAADVLTDKYSSSAYAARASLLAAEVSAQSGDAARAKTRLQWVIDHAGEDGLQQVARLKLGSILLDEKNYAEVAKLLEAKHPASFDALYSDLSGDVLSVQGKKDEARTAYKKALEKLDAKSVYRNLVQMKLDALGGAK